MLTSEINELKNQVQVLVQIVQERHLDLEWLPEPKVIQLLNISKSSLLRLRKSGDLQGSVLAGRVFYKLSDVNKLLNRNTRLK